jgi:hypothetical protein
MASKAAIFALKVLVKKPTCTASWALTHRDVILVNKEFPGCVVFAVIYMLVPDSKWLERSALITDSIVNILVPAHASLSRCAFNLPFCGLFQDGMK